MDILYPKITLGQVDIDAISQYVILNNKLVYRDGENEASSTNAQDVDQVAGVNSAMIAKAVSKESDYIWHDKYNRINIDTLKNRNTVLNAVYLGGRSSNEYMTKDDGDSIGTVQDSMIKAYTSEIQDLKDELYQLRYELERNNFVQKSGFYNGVADYFNGARYRNIQDKVAEIELQDITATTDRISINDSKVFDMFDVYDYVCIVTQNNHYCIRQIKEKKANGNQFVFDSPLKFVYGGATSSETAADSSSDIVSLYKSKGIIHNGMYKFATEPLDQASSTKIYYNGLSDDRQTDIISLDKTDGGYAYSFRVLGEKSNAVQNDSRISEQGYLDYFKILVHPKGSPGRLNCYIFDKADMSRFKNPVQFEDDYKAKTLVDGKPIRFFAKAFWNPNPDLGSNRQYAQFNFCEEGVYPLMSRDEDYNEQVEYVVLLTAENVDASTNRYDILCLKGKTSDDLEVNNNWFKYTALGSNDAEEAITEIPNNHDLFFQISTRAVESNMPSPLATGLYTIHYHNQEMKSDSDGQTAVLTMRIKREGKYVVSTSTAEPSVALPNDDAALLVTPDNTVVNNVSALCLDDNSFKRDLSELSDVDLDKVKNVPVVIGNNITSIRYSNDNTPASIKTRTPVLIDNDDKVYRVGYNVAIKAREVKFDKETGELEIGKYDRLIMPLTNVCKDYESKTDDYSDRLIFSAKLNPLKKYNDFEVQIYWENHLIDESSRFAGYDDTKKQEIIGAIKDLVLSIDKSF